MQIINSFRDGKKDVVTRPLWMNGHRSLIQYYALRDVDGHYLGTIEFTGSVEYILNLFENGGWDQNPDATTGASKHDDAPADAAAPVADASTGASESSADDDTASPAEAAGTPAADSEDGDDATTGASESGSVDADDETADASTGASEN